MSGQFFTRDMSIESKRNSRRFVPATQHPSGFDAKDVEAGLNYARWLYKRWRIEEMNKLYARNGLPGQDIPILLSNRGKHVYESIAKSIRRASGHVLLLEGERLSVIDHLMGLKAQVTR